MAGMGPRLWVVLCVSLLALTAGCGGGDSPDVTAVEISDEQLEMMTLPGEELGRVVGQLTLDPSSGVRDNALAAESSIDPADTAEDLAAAGRINGYARVYSGERGLVSTRVDLWADADAARRGLAKDLGDLERFKGGTFDGVVLSDVERFSVGSVGDESAGRRLRFDDGQSEYQQTLVFFRLGRVVGFTVIVRDPGTDDSRVAEEIAGKLEARVRKVLAGEVRASLVTLGLPLERVATHTALPLTRHGRFEGELGPAYQLHADLGSVRESALATYGEARQDGGWVTIELARADSPEAANRLFDQVTEGALERGMSAGAMVDLQGAGDRAAGRRITEPPGGRFDLGVAVVQIGRIVMVVMLYSDDKAHLAEGLRLVATEQAAAVAASGLSSSAPAIPQRLRFVPMARQVE